MDVVFLINFEAKTIPTSNSVEIDIACKGPQDVLEERRRRGSSRQNEQRALQKRKWSIIMHPVPSYSPEWTKFEPYSVRDLMLCN